MTTKLIGILLLTCASLATGQTAFGNYDCGQWFQQPAAKTWLLGYLTGINVVSTTLANSSKYDPLGNLNSAEQAYLWMNNYCKANSLKTILDGGIDLYSELRGKR